MTERAFKVVRVERADSIRERVLQKKVAQMIRENSPVLDYDESELALRIIKLVRSTL
jgi:hypothetical protein